MDILKHYQADAEIFDYHELNPIMIQEYRRRYECLFRLGNFRSGSFLLEIGTGSGPARRLTEPRGIRHIAVDISLYNLQRLSQEGSWTRPVCAVAGMLPFQDNSLPAVLLAEVIEHIPDPVAALRECLRVLQPGGRIVLSVPWREVIAMHLCIHCNHPTPANAHLHSIHEEKLIQWLTQAGFVRVQTLTLIDKIAHRLRINHLLRFLPYRAWRVVDRFFIAVTNRASTLAAVAVKPE